MTDAQFQVVKNISTADLLSVISVRAATMEDELRRTRNQRDALEQAIKDASCTCARDVFEDPMSQA